MSIPQALFSSISMIFHLQYWNLIESLPLILDIKSSSRGRHLVGHFPPLCLSFMSVGRVFDRETCRYLLGRRNVWRPNAQSDGFRNSLWWPIYSQIEKLSFCIIEGITHHGWPPKVRYTLDEWLKSFNPLKKSLVPSQLTSRTCHSFPCPKLKRERAYVRSLMLKLECRNIIFMIDFLHCTNMLSCLVHLLEDLKKQRKVFLAGQHRKTHILIYITNG